MASAAFAFLMPLAVFSFVLLLQLSKQQQQVLDLLRSIDAKLTPPTDQPTSN